MVRGARQQESASHRRRRRPRLSRRALHGLLPLVAVMACARTSDHQSPAPATRMVSTAPGVSLEVVDWGGSGPPLVFLAGGGGTAHLYDEFAPRFTDHFHAIGITRRGFGASAAAPPPVVLDSLVFDIRAVLDTLGIRSATLIGHSIAGEEMTRFAELDSARCAGLVYVDAAYDRSDVNEVARSQPAVPPPAVGASDLASFANLRALYERVMGVREPDSDIRATNRFDPNGRRIGDVTPDSLKARIGSYPRVARYDRFSCRALAIYAMPASLVDVVPYAAELDSSGRRQATALLAFEQSYIATSRARFARGPDREIRVIDSANHFVFLQRPDTVARLMRSFLVRTTDGRAMSNVK